MGQGFECHGCINPSLTSMEPKEDTYADEYLVHLETFVYLYQYTYACDSSMILENLVNTDMGIDSLLGD